jgi:hypothetical protein
MSEHDYSHVADRLAQVHQQLANAAQQAGRRAEDVRLIAVSKTHPPAAVAAALAAGQRDFGENTVQDALTKIPSFTGQDIHWHFIGHLQSNKTKFIPGHFHWLHSLDSLKLAERLSHQATGQDCTLQCLIEINTSQEASKHGIRADELPGLLESLLTQNLPALQLRGLMTIGPHTNDEAAIRRAFAQLRELRNDSQRRFGLAAFTELSMGMSGDFRLAIAEGSTMVRIGTAIFGQRPSLA